MRYWSNRNEDDGSIHCLGNGRLVVYEQGPDIIQVFGPPYSCPSFAAVKLADDEELLEVESEREGGTAVWRHKIRRNGRYIGEMTDFVDSSVPCMVRQVTLNEEVRFLLQTGDGVQVIDNTGKFSTESALKSALLLYSEAGVFIYNKYPNPKRTNLQFLTLGESCIKVSKDACCREIICKAGESTIYFVGGPAYPECLLNTESVLSEPVDILINRTLKWWKEFSGKRFDFEKLIPENVPRRELILQAIDDIAVLIKVQQSSQGGIIAGHNYHLGYVRDQYGVSRCLLKLGYFEEAREILNFYWNIWKMHGKIHNAQAVGVGGIFHIHENDEVEITGYLIIQAFDYLDKSGDEIFIKEIFPMLEWAWEAQKSKLSSFMLPFNGDETYIAMWILPRSAINDGSAEATLLFVTAGERLLRWVDDNSLWSDDKLQANQDVLQNVKLNYRNNFWDGEKLCANNPDRLLHTDLPRFRHGVCELCSDNMLWTELNASGRYVCPICSLNHADTKVESKRYYLQSVSMVPLFIGSTFFMMDEVAKMAEGIIDQYQKTGRLPSSPDGNTAVGYDYGLLLYTLTELRHPLSGQIFERMFSVLDSTGSWVEMYIDDKPVNTRCRPWESAINLEAAIEFVLTSF